MSERLPRMRTELQLIPTQLQGKRLVAVRDQLDLTGQMVVLSSEAMALLPLFDGEHTKRDMQVLLTRSNGGRLVAMDEVERIVADLDRLCLLQSDSYRHKLNALRKDWNGRADRPASHAGSAYPDDPAELARVLDDILAIPSDRVALDRPVRSVVAPHIDPQIGRVAYAHAYGPVRDLRPERVIVLATGHMLEEPVSVSTKRYRTPLGTSPIDEQAVERLIAAGGESAGDDFAHRSEHAAEFQLLFVQHLFGLEVPVVVVLFGSLGEHLQNTARPSEMADVAPFYRALGELAGEGTLLVAGVDLSHVGPKFGHPQPAVHYQDAFEASDRALLDALEAGSAQRFWSVGQQSDDRWHVCGFPVLTALLTAVPGLVGRVRHYEIWHEAPTRSAVSFAAAQLG